MANRFPKEIRGALQIKPNMVDNRLNRLELWANLANGNISCYIVKPHPNMASIRCDYCIAYHKPAAKQCTANNNSSAHSTWFNDPVLRIKKLKGKKQFVKGAWEYVQIIWDNQHQTVGRAVLRRIG